MGSTTIGGKADIVKKFVIFGNSRKIWHILVPYVEMNPSSPAENNPHYTPNWTQSKQSVYNRSNLKE